MSLCDGKQQNILELDTSPVLGMTLLLGNILSNGSAKIGLSGSPDIVENENCWIYLSLVPNVVSVFNFVPEIYKMK